MWDSVVTAFPTSPRGTCGLKSGTLVQVEPHPTFSSPWQQPGGNAGASPPHSPVLGTPPFNGDGAPRSTQGLLPRPPTQRTVCLGVKCASLLLPGWKYQAILGDILPASVLAEIPAISLSPSCRRSRSRSCVEVGSGGRSQEHLESAQQAVRGCHGQGEWPGNRTCREWSLVSDAPCRAEG